ncbi:MAG: hypothetical protein QM270_11435 [Bacillota bacterium]|nr:hypothetical protein [Bacillota bacterium]
MPIFKNALILKQLGIAIGIPFGIVALLLGLASGRSVYALYGLGLLAALLFFTWLFIMVVYRGKYDAEFQLDAQGAVCRTRLRQAKASRIVNALAVILGLLYGRPTVAGAGMLATSRQEAAITWSRITRVKCRPKEHTILLRGGWMEQLALFCTEENYATVEQEVLARTAHCERNGR